MCANDICHHEPPHCAGSSPVLTAIENKFLIVIKVFLSCLVMVLLVMMIVVLMVVVDC